MTTCTNFLEEIIKKKKKGLAHAVSTMENTTIFRRQHMTKHLTKAKSIGWKLKNLRYESANKPMFFPF